MNPLTNYSGLNTSATDNVIKKKYSPEIKFKQVQYESAAWKRLLGFMLDENVHLKNRLSEILKDKFNNSLLEKVEEFLSRFVKEDELIGLLRNEVVELDKMLQQCHGQEKNYYDVERKLNNIRHNIFTAEKEFGKLKSEFNDYLSVNI